MTKSAVYTLLLYTGVNVIVYIGFDVYGKQKQI